jgi:hypothetical protein
MNGRQWSLPFQDRGQQAPGVLPHVNRDRDGGREAERQRGGQPAQWGHAPGRPADHHHIPRFHDPAATRPAARHSPGGQNFVSAAGARTMARSGKIFNDSERTVVLRPGRGHQQPGSSCTVPALDDLSARALSLGDG